MAVAILMASSLKVTVNNNTNSEMDNLRNNVDGGFSVNASRAGFPIRMVPKDPVKLMDVRVSNHFVPAIPNDRMQRYDKSFVPSGSFQAVQMNNPGPRNDLGKKMNSLVITNSKLTTANQNHSLSGLLFKDK